MSALGTLLAVFGGLLLALPAAGRFGQAVRARLARILLNVLRSIPELVWASLLLVAAGLGPFAGTLALAAHTSGVLGRLFADALENAEPLPEQTLRTNGAAPMAAFLYATLPQTLPQMLSYTLYRWENNIRAAAVLGVVGAGGLGQMLKYHLSLFQMQSAATVIIAMLLLVAAGRRRQFRAAPRPHPLIPLHMLELREPDQNLWRPRRAPRRCRTPSAGRVRRHHGRIGGRQIHFAEPDRRPRCARQRRDHRRRQPMAALDDDAATRLRRSRMGFIFQAFHVLPHLTLAAECGAAAAAQRPGAGRAGAMLAAVGLAAASMTFRASCPAAKCSGWPSRARWCTVRPWCWPMNRPATSIRRPPTASCLLQNEIKASGASAIMVTHSHSAAAKADKILHLTRSGLKRNNVQKRVFGRLIINQLCCKNIFLS
jgi:ABC-type methionine transport system permease subunit/ABC-type ATPase involved in cell division